MSGSYIRINGILYRPPNSPAPTIRIIPDDKLSPTPTPMIPRSVPSTNPKTNPKTKTKIKPNPNPPMKIVIVEKEDISCCVCYDDVKTNDILTCGHPICRECSESLVKEECPVCRGKLEGPSITRQVLSKIKRKIEADQKRERLSRQLIVRLLQRTIFALYVTYGYDLNIMFECGLSVMHGQDPLEFERNRKMKDRICNEYVDLILDIYPDQIAQRENLLFDVSELFTVLDIDM